MCWKFEDLFFSGTKNFCPGTGNIKMKPCLYLFVVSIKVFFPFKDVAVPVEEKRMCDSQVAAGRNNSDYLEVAKKGGGHKGK